MSLNITRDLTVDIIEKELITVDVVEKELITVTLHTADIATKTLNGLNNVEITNLADNDVLTYEASTQIWRNKKLSDIIVESVFIYNEVPIQVTSQKFQTINIYKTGSLTVFFNGIKEKNITEHSGYQTFSLPIDFEVGDYIEVNYVKD